MASLTGDWDSARRTNERIMEIAPGDFESLAPRIALEIESGDLVAGNDYIRQVIELAEKYEAEVESISFFAFARGWSALVLARSARVMGDARYNETAQMYARTAIASPAILPMAEIAANVALAMLSVASGNPSDATEYYGAITDSVQGSMVGTEVSGDRVLGLTAQTMGDLNKALRHFEDAIAFCRNAGYKPELAWSLSDFGEFLLQRSEPGDKQRAVELQDEALLITRDLGMKPLTDRILARRDVLTVTIMFSDIEDSTGITERLGDQQAQELFNAHNRIVRQLVATHQGQEVKSEGDGFMLMFPSSRRALACAIAIQRSLAELNAEQDGPPIHIRVGMHTGEAIKEGDDYFGSDVIMAARIAAMAEGREILVSSITKDLTERSGDFQFDEARDVRLKGLEGRYSVNAVLWN